MILHVQAICHILTTALHQKSDDAVSRMQVTTSEVTKSASNEGNQTDEEQINGQLSVDVGNGEPLDFDGQAQMGGMERSSVVAFVGGVLMALVGCYYFYVTGHQLSIASIRFETGYIGEKIVELEMWIHK